MYGIDPKNFRRSSHVYIAADISYDSGQNRRGGIGAEKAAGDGGARRRSQTPNSSHALRVARRARHVFEQEVEDLAGFETQLRKFIDDKAFQGWSKKMSTLLRESPKRELYLIAE
ncbi:MAG TPA: hypothetical protein VKB84_07050 [Candidatus Binataceae bacterium]|nr:hypothetical protein [Candidatus Binataceae bacterium]